MKNIDGERHLVVFDTNAVEKLYLAPLLRGEACRDFDYIRHHEPPYTPALYVKSFYEICHHVKYGKPFPWMTAESGYPGGLDEGRRILRKAPDLNGEPNLYWWFGLCEEWRYTDWDQKAVKVTELVGSDEHSTALDLMRVQQEFAGWKFKLTAFCEHIWNVLSSEMVILLPNSVFGPDLQRSNEAFQLEQELALHGLVPNEDLEIVVAALINDAVAFVTCEEKILSATALSLSLNWKTAFVHAEQLKASVDSSFQYRWTPEQTKARESFGGQPAHRKSRKRVSNIK